MRPIIIVPFLVLFAGCSNNIHKQTKFLMNTFVEIQVVENDKQKAMDSIAAAFQEMEIIDGILNKYNKNSRVSELNKKKWLKCDRITDKVIKRAIEFSVLTGGAFDITVVPLMQIWKFGNDAPPGKKSPPPAKDLKNAMRLVNYRNIKFRQNKIFLKYGVAIDLSGIAKGWAVDGAIETLRACGIKSAMVNAGGNLRVFGDRTWKIGIQHPRKERGAVMAVTGLTDRAVATSGDYERYFEHDGRRYHHILDPKTGRPAQECISVTIICDDATTADALSTGIFVMGHEKGMALIEKLQSQGASIEVIMVKADGSTLVSKGLKGLKLAY